MFATGAYPRELREKAAAMLKRELRGLGPATSSGRLDRKHATREPRGSRIVKVMMATKCVTSKIDVR